VITFTKRKPERVLERFVNDIANHAMKIHHDDGVYRHVEFSNNGSFHLRFMLTTWPGSLCYSGDMGTFVFRRTVDMFTFFRNHGEWTKPNLDYWSGKCDASDRDGITEFDEETFRNNVARDFRGWAASKDPKEKRAAWEEVKEGVLSWTEEGNREAVGHAMNFRYKGEYPFYDFYEHDNTRFTYRFEWCCHAICWGISQYDASRLRSEAAR
jgi:hypothetical protein